MLLSYRTSNGLLYRKLNTDYLDWFGIDECLHDLSSAKLLYIDTVYEEDLKQNQKRLKQKKECWT